jgi:hypothetical protein
MKPLCLLLKDGGYGVDRVAILEFSGKGMMIQLGPRLVGVVLQGGVEERLEGRLLGGFRGGLTHIADQRNLASELGINLLWRSPTDSTMGWVGSGGEREDRRALTHTV